MNKGFTLIELLVVVAIIGILAAVGVVAYNGYTLSAKERSTLAQLSTVEHLITATLKRCDIESSAKINLNSTLSIDCNLANSKSGINSLLNTFRSYFISQGFKNAYDSNKPIIDVTGSGGDSIDGRLRFDETSCPGQGSSQQYTLAQITIIAKTHKEAKRIFIKKDGWCP